MTSKRLIQSFGLLLVLISTPIFSQVIMFDDFNYSDVYDNKLSFNKWQTINGVSGPPEGGFYSRDNIAFKNDANNSSNKIMTLSTHVNKSANTITHSRIESSFEYFEGTYAARVYFSELPYAYKDANIQTFYTIVSSSLSGDGTKYSELDFEYMAADKWGISADNQVMYLTSWNRYIADPWQAWKRYFSYQRSFEGWHTFIVSCTDGVNVKYWMDGEYMGSMATTDNDGSSVYPRSVMQIAFANWIWNNVIGPSNDDRTTTMEVDWVFFYKDEEIAPQEIENYVADYREQGIIRRNLEGAIEYGSVIPNTQAPFQGVAASIPGIIQAENYDEGGEGVAYHDIDQTNEGKAYRTDGVDVEANGQGGYSVGYIVGGEWMEYTVNVLQEANYVITCQVANNGETSGEFHLEIDGNLIGEAAVVANNGSWYNWISVDLGSTYLTEGEHVIRLVADKESFNIDEIEFALDNATGQDLLELQNEIVIYPNPTADVVYIQSPKEIKSVEVINMHYQILKSTQENQISVQDLKPGVYLLKIQFSDSAVYKLFVKST